MMFSSRCGQFYMTSFLLSFHRSESEMVLLQESSKLRFTLEVVQNLKENGHRVLIFSQSRKMLDIVDKVLTKRVRDTLLLFSL